MHFCVTSAYLCYIADAYMHMCVTFAFSGANRIFPVDSTSRTEGPTDQLKGRHSHCVVTRKKYNNQRDCVTAVTASLLHNSHCVTAVTGSNIV